ncbi:hypothetical protein [Actinomarinicola tropica]|uniref:DUF222 domain-containing protein n=1 Tax=Actinomarinicola tropica TaxID=2789776 RepID=A0A5Q2RHI0_9ACTN|nr:hypothetical protein [Actinomarinicola tropica]QGG96299.1 hypothetical protein GH723_15005 [Actinomarinicola tropica]
MRRNEDVEGGPTVPVAGQQPNLGSVRRVVDLVVGLVTQGNHRQARLQLSALELRAGLAEAADIVGQITAPPPGVDPRTEAQARMNVPDALPSWLAAPLQDEIGRICARQSMREPTVTHIIARILAASIVDESAVDHEEMGFAQRAHVDLTESAEAMGDDTVVDVSNGRGVVAGADPDQARPDRSITDWLGRRA